VTHLDVDHVGGMKEVVEHCAVGAFFMNLPPDAQQASVALAYQRLIKGTKKGIYWELLEKSLDTAVDLIGALAK
jgi:beta-lactamase superfamily II metal-dependent hydrolase